MLHNFILNDIVYHEGDILQNIIVDLLDSLIINITKLLLLILLFALFIIINALVRIHYIYK